MAKGIAAKLLKSRTQRLHQGQNSTPVALPKTERPKVGGEGSLHGGLEGLNKAQRERVERERVENHNATPAGKRKPWV